MPVPVPTALNPAADRPMYLQLADLLRAQITSGQLAGDLPSENELAAKHRISRTTVRMALGLLRHESLIVSERGHPTRVRPGRVVAEQRYRAAKSNYTSPDEESAFAREHGVSWESFDIERSVIQAPAGPAVALLLGVAVGALVYVRSFTHSVDGVILRLSESYLPVHLFEATPLVDPDGELVPGGTIAQLRQLGHDVHRVHTDVLQREATPFEAQMFRVPDGTPLLTARRAMYLLGGDHAIEVAAHVYPPASGTVLAFDTYVGNALPGARDTDAPD